MQYRSSVVTAVRVAAVTALLMCAVAVALLSTSGAAWAHGGSSADYRSVVTGITPASLPVDAKIQGGDDRLRVRNTGSQTLIIYGYDSDPSNRNPFIAANEYVRITPTGVSVNHHSNAFIINQDRYGSTPAGQLSPRPDFQPEKTTQPVFTFHDHRIHWMNRTPPPSVDPKDPAPQPVFTWKIPVKYGNTTGFIVGKLTYIGGKRPGLTPAQWLVVGALIMMLLVFALDVRRRRTRLHDTHESDRAETDEA